MTHFLCISFSDIPRYREEDKEAERDDEKNGEAGKTGKWVLQELRPHVIAEQSVI